MNTKIVSASFARPANTTQYAAGDLVADTVDDSTAAYMTFSRVSDGPNKGIMVLRARLLKSGTTVTDAAFRLHLFAAAPEFTSAGDNGAIATVLVGAADRIGSIDFTEMFAFSDGSLAEGGPVAGTEISHLPGADLHLYGVLEARDTYTPVSEESFTVSLEVATL